MSTLSLNTARDARAARVQPAREVAKAYSDFTVTTAKYPTDIAQLAGNVSAGVLYTAIGLGNEVGELAELFDQEAMRADFRAERYEKAWPELGDVQWYAARLCSEMPELSTFDELVARAFQHLANEPRELRISGFDLQSGLCVHAGRILGVVKKMMRDGATWDDAKREAKVGELRDALYNVVLISVEFAERTAPLVNCPGGYPALLRANTDKLSDRKERGVLQGDGDKR
jgi:hypothetical protein